jgi:hypothetical protein
MNSRASQRTKRRICSSRLTGTKAASRLPFRSTLTSSFGNCLVPDARYRPPHLSCANGFDRRRSRPRPLIRSARHRIRLRSDAVSDCTRGQTHMPSCRRIFPDEIASVARNDVCPAHTWRCGERMVGRLAALVLIGNHLSRTQDPAQSASRPVELPSNLVASLPRSARVTKLAPNWRADWSALAIVKRATVVAWLRNRVGAECFSIAPARQNTMCVVRAHDPIASERRTPANSLHAERSADCTSGGTTFDSKERQWS